MNAPELLKEAQSQGVSLWTEGGRLLYDAPPNWLTEARREALHTHKAEIITRLNRASEDGKALLAPYLPVIKAAHQNELPVVQITMGGEECLLSDYVCQVAAGIWYGVTLKNPLLPAWLENLRRVQAGYEASWIVASAD